MAITTELVGKLGGGLSWTKVTGTQKSIAWNATIPETVLTTVQLDKTKTYIFACDYNYTSGTPVFGTYLAFSELSKEGSTTQWVVGDNTLTVLPGANAYPFMAAHPATVTGKVAVRLVPVYQSGTHVLSADLYYAEMPPR